MAETLHNLYIGFSVALSPNVLLYAFVGCVIGTLVGVLPGVGPLAGISLLLPASFRSGRDICNRSTGRNLLRCHVWRIDDIDTDAHTRRGGFRYDVHRRI